MPVTTNDQPPDWQSFEIEQNGTSVGHCDCCGSTTRSVWGFIHRDDAAVAGYLVRWAEQRQDHGARFDLILGEWGTSTSSSDRYTVALDFRIIEGAGQFMVVDAQDRLATGSEIAGTALKRSDVIGTPLAPQVFALIDAIYMRDPRLDELRAWQ